MSAPARRGARVSGRRPPGRHAGPRGGQLLRGLRKRAGQSAAGCLLARRRCLRSRTRTAGAPAGLQPALSARPAHADPVAGAGSCVERAVPRAYRLSGRLFEARWHLKHLPRRPRCSGPGRAGAARALKSGSGRSGASAQGLANVLNTFSGELRCRPSVVRSVPSASVVRSGSVIRMTPSRPSRPKRSGGAAGWCGGAPGAPPGAAPAPPPGLPGGPCGGPPGTAPACAARGRPAPQACSEAWGGAERACERVLRIVPGLVECHCG